MYRPTLAIDFDGVIHNRPKEEKGNTTITGEPVKGAIQFICTVVKFFDIAIYSARFTGEGSTAAVEVVEQWLSEQIQKYCLGTDSDPEDIFIHIEIARSKPMAKVYLDDRAVCFDGEFPSIDKLLKFRTWQGR